MKKGQQKQEIKIKSVFKNKNRFILELDSGARKVNDMPYNYIYTDGTYHIRNKEKQLITPSGIPVATAIESLAYRCVLHLNQYGEEYQMSYSILTFLYSYIDFGEKATKEEKETHILHEFDNEWIFDCPYYGVQNTAKWERNFGEFWDRRDELERWLSSLSKFQLSAVIIIEATLESVNTAFILANKKKVEEIPEFAEYFSKCFQYYHKKKEMGSYWFYDYDGILKIFNNYIFCYNLGL